MTRHVCSLRKLLYAGIAVLIVCGAAAQAQEARLKDIIVTNTRDDLLVYLTVEGAFNEQMREAIASGVPTTFRFFVSLYEDRKLWFDRKIADIKVTHTIKYDNLKREYSIQRSWAEGDPKTTHAFTEARELMSEIDHLHIIPLSRLERGKLYQIRAKAGLSKLKLPLNLQYALFFVSLWNFETDWYTVSFIY